VKEKSTSRLTSLLPILLFVDSGLIGGKTDAQVYSQANRADDSHPLHDLDHILYHHPTAAGQLS
jgi:hypothetical protein